jgi:membrane protease subunit (stomatin/prohibitin family)
MGIFSGQLANVVEWEEYRDDIIFWKWTNREIKKGSRLIIRAGQDAIFMYNGKIEGIFTDEGSFDIESQIIPFLSSLKGFKFGFNSGIRAEVLFVNTKEFTVKWGTKNPVAIPTQSLPGGMPIRAFGTFSFKVSDYLCMIDKIAGVKKQYMVDDVKERVVSVLDSLLMRWISQEGKDMFNLQANAMEIGRGIKGDLDMEMSKIGLAITDFAISSFSYPEEVRKMQEKAASQAMVGDMGKYSQLAMADSLANGNSAGAAGMGMAGMQMGMMMGQQMVNNMAQMQAQQNMMNQGMQTQNAGSQTVQPQNAQQPAGGSVPKFCPECGTPTNGAKFCPECGKKLQ